MGVNESELWNALAIGYVLMAWAFYLPACSFARSLGNGFVVSAVMGFAGATLWPGLLIFAGWVFSKEGEGH